jgi:hypothetical protein
MAALGGASGGADQTPATSGWEQALLGKGVFPLRVVTTLSGKETFRMEATAIKKAPQPALLFAPPADFQNLGQMMQGIPGLPPGMKLPGTR